MPPARLELAHLALGNVVSRPTSGAGAAHKTHWL